MNLIETTYCERLLTFILRTRFCEMMNKNKWLFNANQSGYHIRVLTTYINSIQRTNDRYFFSSFFTDFIYFKEITDIYKFLEFK